MRNHHLPVAIALVFTLPSAVAAQTPKAITIPVKTATLKNAQTKKYRMVVRYPSFSGNSPVVERAGDALTGVVYGLVDDYIRDYEKDGINLSSVKQPYELKPVVVTARPDFISLYFIRIVDNAGAHPASDYVSYSHGVVNGVEKTLQLKDLFEPDADVDTLTKSALVVAMRRKGYSESLIEKAVGAPMNAWVVSPKGITFLYPAGTFDTYASGNYEILCSWKDIERATGIGGLSKVVAPLRR